MPAANKLTVAALLAVTVSIAGCNSSKKASSTDSGAVATTAAAPAAAAGSDAVVASAPAAAAPSTSAGCPLTGAQATTAMGSTYADPTVAYDICSYLGSNNAFTIIVHDATGVFDFNGTLATAKQDEGTDTSTAISGLGDKAAGTGLEIVVQSGGKTIDIRNADESPEGGWPKSVALAKLVIAGLH